MRSLFADLKVVRVVLNQTWPTANRRSGMLAFARLCKDGRIALYDDKRKRFYDNAKEGVHFVTFESLLDQALVDLQVSLDAVD